MDNVPSDSEGRLEQFIIEQFALHLSYRTRCPYPAPAKMDQPGRPMFPGKSPDYLLQTSDGRTTCFAELKRFAADVSRKERASIKTSFERAVMASFGEAPRRYDFTLLAYGEESIPRWPERPEWCVFEHVVLTTVEKALRRGPRGRGMHKDSDLHFTVEVSDSDRPEVTGFVFSQLRNTKKELENYEGYLRAAEGKFANAARHLVSAPGVLLCLLHGPGWGCSESLTERTTAVHRDIPHVWEVYCVEMESDMRIGLSQVWPENSLHTEFLVNRVRHPAYWREMKRQYLKDYCEYFGTEWSRDLRQLRRLRKRASQACMRNAQPGSGHLPYFRPARSPS